MTIIEFFDKTHIENIVSTLLLKPKKVIFVGNNRKMMERCTENYSEVVKRHGIETEFVFCTVNQNDLLKIVQELSQIVEREEECVFDLSGGEDLYLVAVGILFERYGEKIQMHRYNISNGRLTDCDSQGDVQFYNNLSVSVEDNVRIYGGKIIRDSFSENFDNATVFDDDFRKDIDSMWNISSQNSRLWNNSVNVIQFFYSAYGEKDWMDKFGTERIVWLPVDEKGVVAMGSDSYRSPKDEAPQAVTDALLAWCREAVPRLHFHGGYFRHFPRRRDNLSRG